MLLYHKPITIAKLSPEELKQEKLVIDPFYNYRRDRKDTVHLQKTKDQENGLVNLSLKNKLTVKKKNQQKKQNSKETLSQQLQKPGICVTHAYATA